LRRESSPFRRNLGSFWRDLGAGEGEEGVGVGDAEVGEVQLAGLEAAEADDVPEGAGDVAAEFVPAVGGEGDPAFGAGEEDREAGGGGDGPETEGAVEGGGGSSASAAVSLALPGFLSARSRT
jgi:hypothetical protein